MSSYPNFSVIGITNIPEIKTGDNLANIIDASAKQQGTPIQNNDILVIAQKIVSKAEGLLIDLNTIAPSPFAKQIAEQWDKDARHVEVVLRESRRIVRMGHGVLITETHHGFICANSGVDASNLPGEEIVSPLPPDPDNSARIIRDDLKKISDQKNNSPDLLVIGTNSKGIDWCPEQLKKIGLENTLPPILLLTKGLNVHNNQYELLAEKLQRLLLQEGFDNINISVVGGPCLARDLANKIHSSVVIANKDLKIARWLQELLRTNYYHISITNDIIGVEVCAAIKNIFSMIIGSAKGLNLKEKNNNQNKTDNLNSAAALFSQCLYEMELFVSFLKGKKETVRGLAGIGDLYVSAAGGRNSLMGSYLGQGFLYSEVKEKKMKDITVEGAELAFEIYSLINKDFNLKQMPLMIAMIDSVVNNKKINIEWKYFN